MSVACRTGKRAAHEYATTSPPDLEPYREQARELQDALAKVKDIQAQTAAVTLQRDNVLQQRETLLDKWEDESAVAELSKLGSRVEMCEAKLASLAGKLASAESDLKQVLETFGTSFRNLHSQLSTFLFTAALEHLTSLVHPELRVRSKSACAEVAWLDERVVEVQPLRIPNADRLFPIHPAPRRGVAGRGPVAGKKRSVAGRGRQTSRIRATAAGASRKRKPSSRSLTPAFSVRMGQTRRLARGRPVCLGREKSCHVRTGLFQARETVVKTVS